MNVYLKSKNNENKMYLLLEDIYDKTIESIQDDYIWNKENDKNKNKEKNDYEIGM